MADSFKPDAPVQDSFTADPEPAKPKPGADVMAQLEHKAKGGFLTNPQGWTEKAANLAVTAPLTAAGGLGLGALATKIGLPALKAAAPLVGRVATSGALGAAEADARGDSPTLGALFGAATAGLAEGVASKVASGIKLPLVGKLEGLTERGAPARAYKYGTEALGKVVDAIKSRLPGSTKLSVPSLGSTPVTLEQAVTKLKGLTKEEYEITRREIMSELDRLDAARVVGGVTPRGTWGPVKPPRPYAGQQFGKQTTDIRVPPSMGAAGSEAARTALTSNEGRAVADALAAQQTEAGLPLGALAAMMLAEKTGQGVGHVVRGTRE